MAGPNEPRDQPATATGADPDLAELSDEDRAFVREARRRLAERQNQPPIAAEIQERMQSEVGGDDEQDKPAPG